jgi:hypothetical protein
MILKTKTFELFATESILFYYIVGKFISYFNTWNPLCNATRPSNIFASKEKRKTRKIVGNLASGCRRWHTCYDFLVIFCFGAFVEVNHNVSFYVFTAIGQKHATG